MKIIRQIIGKRDLFGSVLRTIYFNFKMLPFKQAIKLPVFLYKPKFGSLKGRVEIEGPIKTGMINLGRHVVSLYPNTGIFIENDGLITFKSRCDIGNNSFLSINKCGKLFFGKEFSASTSIKIACYHSIFFSDYVRVGWDCLFMDTDLHRMKKLSGEKTKGYGSIFIGTHNWFGSKCVVLKKTKTPSYCTISAGTFLNSKIDVPEYSVVANERTTKVIASGIWRDLDDDVIEYEPNDVNTSC